MSEGIFDDVKGLFGGEDSSSEASEVKKEIIKGALGEEDVDLDDVDDEGLDNILAKVVKVEEKVAAILDFGKGWSEDQILKCVHEKTGMHLDESKEVIDYVRGL